MDPPNWAPCTRVRTLGMLAAQSGCTDLLSWMAGWAGVGRLPSDRLGDRIRGSPVPPPQPRPMNGRQRAAKSLLFPESALGHLRGARPKQNLALQR